MIGGGGWWRGRWVVVGLVGFRGVVCSLVGAAAEGGVGWSGGVMFFFFLALGDLWGGCWNLYSRRKIGVFFGGASGGLGGVGVLGPFGGSGVSGGGQGWGFFFSGGGGRGKEGFKGGGFGLQPKLKTISAPRMKSKAKIYLGAKIGARGGCWANVGQPLNAPKASPLMDCRFCQWRGWLLCHKFRSFKRLCHACERHRHIYIHLRFTLKSFLLR